MSPQIEYVLFCSTWIDFRCPFPSPFRKERVMSAPPFDIAKWIEEMEKRVDAYVAKTSHNRRSLHEEDRGWPAAKVGEPIRRIYGLPPIMT